MGFTDLSRLFETVLPLLRAMLLTRQGISLGAMLLIHKEFSLGINDEFQLILHVAMQIGLYLHRQHIGVWRVVSEDSGLHQSFLLIDCTVRFSLPLTVE